MKQSLLLPKNHVFLSLQRGRLFLGCDRELIMTLILICTALSVAAPNPLIWGLALGLLILGFVTLHKAALCDPLWRHVYVRSLRYKPYYEAREALNGCVYILTSNLFKGKESV